MKKSTKASYSLLYANQSMGMGGAESFMADLLNQLAEEDQFEVSIASTHHSFLELATERSINTQHLPVIVDLIGNWKGLIKAVLFLPFAFVQWLFALLAFKQKRGQEVILLSGFNEKLIVTPLAKLVKMPVIWIEFSSLDSVLQKWWGVIGWWYLFCLRFVEQIITSSKHSKHALLKELKVDSQQVNVIPCGRVIPSDQASAVESPFSFPYLLSVSRLQPGKGQDLLLRAFSLLHTEFPKLRVVLVGEGDFLSTLKHLVEEFNLQEKVIFTGRVDQVQQYYQHARVFVFPSVWQLEGFGLVLVEAMANRVPVVTFNRGPLNEIIEHNITGLLAKSGSAEDLADKIRLVLKDEKLSQKLSNHAEKKYQTTYTINQAARKYAEEIEAVISRSKAD